MGGRTLIVLLLLVGGLAIALWWTDERPAPRDVAERAVLDGRSLRECRRLWWRFEGRAPVEVSREGQAFLLTEPLRDAVSPGYLKQIVDTWDTARMRATPLVDDDEGRAKAGLAPPLLQLLVEYPDGTRLDIEVGAPGPLGSTRFLRMHGKIWEGGEALVESMRVGVDDLRDRAVFRNTAQVATELRVEQVLRTGKREAIHLVREKGEWRLREPRTGRADPTEAMRFLTSVLGLRVDDFAPGTVRLPTEEPEIVILARGAFGEETLRLWQREGQVFGILPGRSNLVFTSDNRQYGAVFENAVDQLRARILVPMGSVYEELVEILVDPGQGRGDRLRLLRDGVAASWRLVEPVTYPANPTACNELCQAINNLHAMEFVETAAGEQATADDPAFGLGAGRLQVSVRGEGQKQPVVLWFGAAAQKGGYELVHAVRADDLRNVVLVPKLPVDHLRRAWVDYCALAVVRQTAVVDRVDLARRATGERRLFRQDRGHWVLDGAGGTRDEVGEFANDVLRDLVAKRAVDARGDAFRAADWTLALSRANGDVLAMVRVFERGGDAPLLLLVGDAPVGFEVGALVDKQLRALWQ